VESAPSRVQQPLELLVKVLDDNETGGRGGTLIVKWDLDNKKAMKGTATRRVLKLIVELESEGVL